MRVSICVGDYAKTPYRVPGLLVNVFSMEELCCCIRENAFLLDFSFLDGRLIEWIEKECGLKELAKALHPLVHRQGSLSAFAVTILRYVGFYEEAVIRETEQVLKQGIGLSGIERRKNQIDYLVRKKKYKAALRGYEELEQKWTEQEEAVPAKEFLAKIWHNKGVAYTGLMLYERAAECFRQAWDLSGSAGEAYAFLTARRMGLSEADYVAFAGTQNEWRQYILELEKEFEKASGEWEQQPEYLRLFHLREDKGRDRERYHRESESLIQALKDNYR